MYVLECCSQRDLSSSVNGVYLPVASPLFYVFALACVVARCCFLPFFEVTFLTQTVLKL